MEPIATFGKEGQLEWDKKIVDEIKKGMRTAENKTEDVAPADGTRAETAEWQGIA